MLFPTAASPLSPRRFRAKNIEDRVACWRWVASVGNRRLHLALRGLHLQVGTPNRRRTLHGRDVGGALRAPLSQDLIGLVLVNPIGLEDWEAKGVSHGDGRSALRARVQDHFRYDQAISANHLLCRNLETGFRSLGQYVGWNVQRGCRQSRRMEISAELGYDLRPAGRLC